MSAGRADRLAALLAERDVDALVVTNLVNVRYLTGFTGTNGACVVTPEGREFLTDFRYVEQAAEQVTGFETVRAKQDMLADLAERLDGRGARRIGFEDQHMTVRQHAKLGEKLADGSELVAAGGLVERLRAVKDDEEVRLIAAATELADGVFRDLFERGLEGRTEREVALWAEREMRERGASDPSFPSIVAAGAHGALPHAEPRDAAIRAGDLVTVDMGCILDGYCSDCTRTVAVGEPPGEAREVYELVLAAQVAAVEAVRAGADCKAVDSLARDLISEGGHGEEFGHGLGHGVGLEVHEGPRLSQLSPDGELEAGNVVTVEPGVYVPGTLGVRIEDLVVVREDGCDILTSVPKDLTVVA